MYGNFYIQQYKNIILYLKTEDESNKAQNEETEQHVDDGENQVVVWLCPNMSISSCWLLSHYNLQGEMTTTPMISGPW